MPKIKTDPQREQRIVMEIVVDCDDEWERAMGWYYYLLDTMSFPFAAKCMAKRATSPLQLNDEVEIIGMPSEEVCEHEMFVQIRWKENELAVPLAQLQTLKADAKTVQAVEDWHYWVGQGYQF